RWHHKDFPCQQQRGFSRRPVLSPLAPLEPVSERAWPFRRKRPLGLRTLSATRGKARNRDEPRRFHSFARFFLCGSNLRRKTMPAPQGLAVPQQRGSLVGRSIGPTDDRQNLRR